MIRAAALSYAIVFALLVGLICSGVIIISATQKKIEVLQTNKEHLLFDSYEAVRYGMYTVAPGDSAQYIHDSGDTSEVWHRQWGAFSMICTTTHKFPLSRQRSALIGMVQSPELPCLYLPGNMTTLKITGDTRLEGEACVPIGIVDPAYIAGKNYLYDKFVFGKITRSETSLPALKTAWNDVTPARVIGGAMKNDFIPKDSIYGFDVPCTYYQSVAPIVVSQKISGNVILHSFDSIYVESQSHLQNVILVAPIVRFESGFSGTVQVLASERVSCERGVKLLYPSIIVLNDRAEQAGSGQRTITVDEDAKVLGGILVTSQHKDYRNLPFLRLAERSVVAGLIYNAGETEARGAVIGSLYTEQLSVQMGGEYVNHLVDALISRKRLPGYFVLPGWLEAQNNVQSKVIAWL